MKKARVPYQQLLDRVSRSFALCVPELEPPFREQVGLAYLLLRILDTIEDAPFHNVPLQQRLFDQWRGFLRAQPSEHEVDAFAAAFPVVTDDERMLLAETFALLEDLHALPDVARTPMVHAIESMTRGMAAYAARPTPLRLVDLEDVSRYCCFVAGVVGEMLTTLFAASDSGMSAVASMKPAYQFGLFLQKVNILKDQREDEAADRFLVPDREALLASVRNDARGALAYLQSLPESARGYRTFCAWSLMMGLMTIANLDGAPQSRRAQTGELLARTSSIVGNNRELGVLFHELMPPPTHSAAQSPSHAKPESFEWFRTSLASNLTLADLHDIGVGSP